MDEHPTLSNKTFKWDAFISYRRSDGTRTARWIRNRLERYRLPAPLKGIKKEKLRLYLDTAFERANEDFFEKSIVPALKQSQFLIVVCTPDALKPKADGQPNWVYREIDTFYRLPNGSNILVVLAKGDLQDPLPGHLHERFPQIQIVDLRGISPSRFLSWSRLWRHERSLLQLVAPLYDVSATEMPVLRQEETRRRQKKTTIIAGVSLFLAASLSALTIWALVSLTKSRQELVHNHTLQGRLLFENEPTYARLHFARAVEIASPSRLLDIGITLDATEALSWLGQGWDSTLPQILWHQGWVSSATFSPDDQLILTHDGANNIVQSWNAISGKPMGPPIEPSHSVHATDFLPNGRQIYTLDRAGSIYFWDSENGQLLDPSIVNEGGIEGIHISKDEIWLVTIHADGTAQVWDAVTRTPLGKPITHNEGINSVSIHTATGRVVTAGNDGTAQIWEASTGKALVQPLKHHRSVLHVAFSPDGTRIATVSGENVSGPEIPGNMVQLWDAVAGTAIGKPMQHKSFARFFGFSLDSKWILTGDEKEAHVWNAFTGVLLSTSHEHSKDIRDAHFSPNGSQYATASLDGTTRLWNTITGRPQGPVLLHGDGVFGVEFDSQGHRLLTASHDRTARIWKVDSEIPKYVQLNHNDYVYAAHFNPEGNRVVTACDDGNAYVWDVETGDHLITLPYESTVYAVQFSPDGQRIVTTYEDGTAQLWDAMTGAPLGKAMQHEGDIPVVRSGVFSADSRLVLTASLNGSAQLWDAMTGEAVRGPLWHKNYVYAANFSPNGQRIITASFDSTAQIWDVATSQRVGQPLLHEAAVRYATFSPDSRRAVTASHDGTAQIWDVATSQRVGQPLLHEAAVRYATFSPDNRRVVTVGSDEIGRIWEAETGNAIAKPLVHAGVVYFASFSPDSRRIVTASDDHKVQVWAVATGNPIGSPLLHSDAVNYAAFGPKGQHVVTISEDNRVRIWNLAPESAPASLIRLKAEVASAFTLDEETQEIQPLIEAEWQIRWDALNGKQTSWLDRSQ